MGIESWLLTGLFMITSIMLMVGLVFVSNDIVELGSSICEEEYNLSFEKYDGETLHCSKPLEKYDGITVQIGGTK